MTVFDRWQDRQAPPRGRGRALGGTASPVGDPHTFSPLGARMSNPSPHEHPEFVITGRKQSKQTALERCSMVLKGLFTKKAGEPKEVDNRPSRWSGFRQSISGKRGRQQDAGTIPQQRHQMGKGTNFNARAGGPSTVKAGFAHSGLESAADARNSLGSRASSSSSVASTSRAPSAHPSRRPSYQPSAGATSSRRQNARPPGNPDSFRSLKELAATSSPKPKPSAVRPGSANAGVGAKAGMSARRGDHGQRPSTTPTQLVRTVSGHSDNSTVSTSSACTTQSAATTSSIPRHRLGNQAHGAKDMTLHPIECTRGGLYLATSPGSFYPVRKQQGNTPQGRPPAHGSPAEQSPVSPPQRMPGAGPQQAKLGQAAALPLAGNGMGGPVAKKEAGPKGRLVSRIGRLQVPSQDAVAGPVGPSAAVGVGVTAEPPAILGNSLPDDDEHWLQVRATLALNELQMAQYMDRRVLPAVSPSAPLTPGNPKAKRAGWQGPAVPSPEKVPVRVVLPDETLACEAARSPVLRRDVTLASSPQAAKSPTRLSYQHLPSATSSPRAEARRAFLRQAGKEALDAGQSGTPPHSPLIKAHPLMSESICGWQSPISSSSPSRRGSSIWK